MSISYPAIGDRVALRDQEQRFHASYVEGYGEDYVVLDRPNSLVTGVVYDAGLPMQMLWGTDLGVTVYPVQLMDTEAERKIRLWRMRFVGQAWVEQRREYVRVPLKNAINLWPQNATESIVGEMIDLSEAAALCKVRLPIDEPLIAPGTELMCSFTVYTKSFELPGEVLSLRPGRTSNETGVVIAFTRTDDQADSLRRELFAVQIAMRKER